MEDQRSSSVALFLAAVRSRLNQRKISLQDFIDECKLRNKNKISIFQFAIIVQRINCGTAFFKARYIFTQINQRKDYITMDTFKALFLKASKMPLLNIELSRSKSQRRMKSKTTLDKKQVVQPQIDEHSAKIQKKRKYYSQIGFHRLVKFVTTNSAKPQKIFDDCDLNHSGFIDRNQFNKFLVASEIFEFKDLDVRRYLINEVLQKLKTEQITKEQFFEIFTINKKEKISGLPLVNINSSVKYSEKKVQPVRSKIMSYSVSVVHQKEPVRMQVKQKGRKARKNKRQQVDQENQEEGDQGIQLQQQQARNRKGGHQYNQYQNHQNDRQQGDEQSSSSSDSDQDQGNEDQPYGNPNGANYGEFYDPNIFNEYGPGMPGKVEPLIPFKPIPKPYPYNPQMQPVQPIRPVQPFQPFQQIQPFQPIQPVLPVQPLRPVQPVKPVQPVQPIQPIQPVLPVKPVQPVQPVQPVKPVQPVQPLQPVQPVKPVQPVQPVQPLQPVKPVQPTQPVQPVQPVQPTAQTTISKKASQYYRFGVPKQKDMPYVKQFEQLLAKNTKYLDKQNPKIIKKFTYKPVGQIFQQMELIDDKGKYSLFSQSAESRNQNRNNKEFSIKIQADDIKQGEVGDCYYLCSIAAVAYDYPQVLAEKFLFEVNPANYYVTKLFIDGQWKYIKTDDNYAAVEGNTGYCHPRQAQIWVMLLEKCFAKVYGDYSIIDGGFEQQAFFALTGASSDYFVFQENKDYAQAKKKIVNGDRVGYLMSCAGDQKMISHGDAYLEKMGLVSGHAYSLLAVFDTGKQLLVKLRNPWGSTVYQGDWSFNSKKWTPELRKKLSFEQKIENGTFYMSWDDFTKFYSNVTICKIHPTFVHTSFRMTNNIKKSNYIQMKVATRGTYHLFICLQSNRKFTKTNPKYTYSRKRIILVRKNTTSGKFQFIAATANSEDRQICSIQTQLQAGTYLISAKVKWANGWKDHQCFLVSYGTENVSFQLADRSIAPKFKAEMISSYALVKSAEAEKKDYKTDGIPGVTNENYFNSDEGIGYYKVLNRGKKAIGVAFEFQLQQEIKPIKPNQANWNAKLKSGEDGVIGFFIGGSYGYSIGESLEYI